MKTFTPFLFSLAILSQMSFADLSAPLPEIIIEEEDGSSIVFQEKKEEKVEPKVEAPVDAKKTPAPTAVKNAEVKAEEELTFEIVGEEPAPASKTDSAPKIQPSKPKKEEVFDLGELAEPEVLETPKPKVEPKQPKLVESKTPENPQKAPDSEFFEIVEEEVPVKPAPKTKPAGKSPAPKIEPTPEPEAEIVVVEEPKSPAPKPEVKPEVVEKKETPKTPELEELFVIEEPTTPVKPTAPVTPEPPKVVPAPKVDEGPRLVDGPSVELPPVVETPAINPVPTTRKPDLDDLTQDPPAPELSEQDVASLIFHLQQDARKKESQKATLVPNLRQEEINFANVPVAGVLSLLAEQAGFNFIAPNMPEENISLRLKNMTPLEAFNHVAKNRGYVVVTKGGVTTLSRPDIKVPEFLVVKKYNLQHVHPKWIMQQIANLLELEAGEPADTLSTYPAPVSSGTGGGQGGGTTAGGGGGAGGQGSSSGFGGGGGQGGGQNVGLPSETRWKSSLPFDEPAYKGKAVEGSEDVKYAFVDRGGRAIVIRATVSDHETLEQYIKSADKQEPQIIIEAKIVEVGNDENLNFGTDWNQVLNSGFNVKNLDKAFDWNDILMGGDTASLSADQAQLLIRALTTRGKAQISNMPKAITRSSVPVGITSIETKSLDAQVSENVIDGGTTINTGAALNTFQTGLSLDVVPQLMANGIVDLNISVSVASETPKADGDENRNPTINSRTLTTSTSVPSQMTLLIGGLSIVTKTETVNGIPVLSKIPVIGETVFANKSKGEQKRTLLVFVTPTVIYPNEVPKTYVNYDEWDTIRNGETHNPQIERAPMPRAPEVRRAIPVGNGMR